MQKTRWITLFIVISILTISHCLFVNNDAPKKKLSAWSGPMIKRSDWRNLKLLFLMGIISVETASEIYIRAPQEIVYGSSPSPISLSKGQEQLVLIFPGANGPDQYTDKLKNRIIASDREKGLKRDVQVYDWLKWRSNYLRASFDGQAVGTKVCGALAEEEKNNEKPIKTLHAVGISVGAFAADSCIKTFNNLATTPAKTRLTLLDPFTSKGVFGYGWGVKNFGIGADVVEDYLNSDDPVPTTNDPVVTAYTLDVTNSKLRDSFKPEEGMSNHAWPGKLLNKCSCFLVVVVLIVLW